MIERIFIQVIAVLAFGDLLSKIFGLKRKGEHFDNFILDNFINAMVLGYGGLIFSMVLSALLFDLFIPNALKLFVYLYFSIGMILATTKFFQLLYSFRSLTFDNLWYREHKGHFIIILFIVFGYLIMSLILPERGWDALNYYFPNGIYFFYTDDIPGGAGAVNHLTGYPTFKPPISALLITYSQYVTNGMNAQLHPFLFLIGTAILIYKISTLLGVKVETALKTVIIFLIFPLSYFLILIFAYYQEPPLMFFFTASIYYIMKIERGDKSSILLASIAIAMAILSKLSGYALPFVILMVFNFKFINNKLKMVILCGITIFLFQNSMYDVYIGISVFILFIALILSYMIIQDDPPKPNCLIGIKSLIGIFIFPLIMGTIWFIFMITQDQSVRDYLIQTFISRNSSFISWRYPAIATPIGASMDLTVRVSFVTSILYLFTGSLAGLMLLPYKIIGTIQFPKYKELSRWILSFCMLYYAYFAEVSFRYLIPVIPPFVIFIGLGYEKFSSKLKLHEWQSFAVFSSTVFFGYFFYLPVLPLRNWGFNIIETQYYYHANQILILIYAVLFFLLMKLFISKLRRITFKRTKIWAIIFIILMILVPFSLPIGLFISGKLGGPDVNSVLIYENRPNVQDVISFLHQYIYSTDSSLILGYQIPGFGYYLNRPVLDLAIVVIRDVLKPRWQGLNESASMEEMIHYNIKYIILLTPENWAYDLFKHDVASLNMFHIVVEGPNFSKIYQNPEFQVFSRINQGAYIPPNSSLIN